MTLIHFLKRSSNLFWIAALMLTIGWIGLNPINSYGANAEGLYSGTFNGNRSGDWFLVVDESGNGQIYFWIEAEKVIDTGKLNVNGQGGFTFKCTYGLSGNGSIKEEAEISGDWKLGGVNGEFKGIRQDASKLKNIAGTYVTSCSGNETGELTLIVANNGAVTGTVTWEKNGLVEEGSGAVNSSGNFVFHTQDDTGFYGTLKSLEDVNGNWNNPFWETQGTLGDTPVVKNNSKSSSVKTESMPVYVESQEESSNGCFIQTVTPN